MELDLSMVPALVEKMKTKVAELALEVLAQEVKVEALQNDIKAWEATAHAKDVIIDDTREELRKADKQIEELKSEIDRLILEAGSIKRCECPPVPDYPPLPEPMYNDGVHMGPEGFEPVKHYLFGNDDEPSAKAN